MKKLNNEEVTTVAKKKSRGVLKIVLIIVVVLCLCTIGLVILARFQPIWKLESLYKDREKLIAEIEERTPKPVVLVKKDKLSELTDEQVFEFIKTRLVSTENDGATLPENITNMADFVNATLEAYSLPYKYEQLTSVAAYLQAVCNGYDFTEFNLENLIADYFIDLRTVYDFQLAGPAINEAYKDYHETYLKIGKEPEVKEETAKSNTGNASLNEDTVSDDAIDNYLEGMKTGKTEDVPIKYEYVNASAPLEFDTLINRMITDNTLRAELNGYNTTLHRILESKYNILRQDYINKFNTFDTLVAMYFSTAAQSEEDLRNLEMMACDKFDVSGTTLPLNTSEEDVKLLNEATTKIAEQLGKCNLRFGVVTDENEDPSFVERVLRLFTQTDTEEIMNDLMDKSRMMNAGLYNSTTQLVEQNEALYQGDFVFWNIYQGRFNFTDENVAMSSGYPLVHYNFRAVTLDNVIIEKGYARLDTDHSMLDSLLWTMASIEFVEDCYGKTGISYDEEGKTVLEETDDEVTIGYRSFFEALQIKSSAYLN